MSDPARCPTCSESNLSVRHLESAGVRVHECEVCSGIWVLREVVHALVQKLRTECAQAGEPPPPVPGAPERQLRLYRACPSCNVLMNRKGCGEIILDVCALHGVWFDPGELEAFLHWTRGEAGRQQTVLPGSFANTAASMALVVPPSPGQRESAWANVFDGIDLIEPLCSCLLEILSGILE